MLTLIKNVYVYAPEDLGRKDILLAGGKICAVEDSISFETDVDFEIIDGSDLTALPGFIDQHVHLIGGGGENGYSSRTPEVMFSEIIKYGITTVIGLLGTDGTSRHMESLYAKAKGLEEEGITTYIYSGSYELPLVTLTGSLKRDILLNEKIIGAGEVAISDHRSSAPTIEEITRLATDSRVAGMLSRKAGVVHLHVGDGKDKLDMINEIVEKSDIPIYHFRPTHVNRNRELLEEAIKFAKRGGFIDITSSTGSPRRNPGEFTPAQGVKHCLDNGVDIKHVTMSSDGNGSMPAFDDNGNIIGLTAASLESLYTEFKFLVKEESVPISDAVRTISTNIADSLKLTGKGHIKAGFDADLNLLDNNLDICHVFAKGQKVIGNKEVLVKGVFEK